MLLSRGSCAQAGEELVQAPPVHGKQSSTAVALHLPAFANVPFHLYTGREPTPVVHNTFIQKFSKT